MKKQLNIIKVASVVFLAIALIVIVLNYINKDDNTEEPIKPNYAKSEVPKETTEEYKREAFNISETATAAPEIQKAESFLSQDPAGSIDSTKIFGNPSNKFLDENVYEQLNIRTKDSFGRLNYILFTRNYPNEIISGIKVNDTREMIIEKLGLQIADIKKDGVTVQKNNYYIYIDFNNKNALYFPKLNTDLSEFKQITENYYNSKDVKNYVTSLTQKYPRYTDFRYSSTSLDLIYYTLGIEIYHTSFAKIGNEQGILIYKNSPIYEEMKKLKEDLSDDSNYKNNILKISILESDLVAEKAGYIASKENVARDSRVNYKVTTDFVVSGSKENTRNAWGNLTVIFTPALKRAPYNLTQSGSADGVTYNEKKIYYNVNGEGIYEMDPFTKQKTLIYQTTEALEIVDIEGNNLKMKDGSEFNLIYKNIRKDNKK